LFVFLDPYTVCPLCVSISVDGKEKIAVEWDSTISIGIILSGIMAWYTLYVAINATDGIY
jgi:hypothetical protein